MNQDISRSLKPKYRKNVVRKIVPSAEKKKTPPKISLLQGMQMSVSAWDALSTQTTVICFRKSGISTNSQETAIAEEGTAFRELQDEIDNLCSIQPSLIDEDFDATTFADVDTEVIAVQPPPSDAEIVAELSEREGISDDDDDDDDDDDNDDDDGDYDYDYSVENADEPVKCPDKNELL